MITRHLNHVQKAIIGTLVTAPLSKFEIDKQYRDAVRSLVKQKLVSVDTTGRYNATEAGLKALETGTYERQALTMPHAAVRPAVKPEQDQAVSV